MNSHRSILEIANAIVNDATTLDQYLRSSVLPQPSFDEDGPRKLSRKDSGRRTRRRSLQACGVATVSQLANPEITSS